jgi:hypothetical protein
MKAWNYECAVVNPVGVMHAMRLSKFGHQMHLPSASLDDRYVIVASRLTPAGMHCSHHAVTRRQ